MATYHDELCGAMKWLSTRSNVIFVGQGVGNPGTGMSLSLEGVPHDKREEFPVAEEMQTGVCIGLSLSGYVPISIIPRWNFMICATNQIVNHLDRMPLYSGGKFHPKIIIRTAVPSTSPFNPGPQHDADFTDAFKAMVKTIEIVRLFNANAIMPEYQRAFDSPLSTILVEYTDFYRNARAGR